MFPRTVQTDDPPTLDCISRTLPFRLEHVPDHDRCGSAVLGWRILHDSALCVQAMLVDRAVRLLYGSVSKRPELMATPSCSVPFERGSELCRNCRRGPEVEGVRRCSRFVAESAAMRALLTRTAPIAATDASVVITGESGTGKEVLARALHVNSPRAGKPFVAVNVTALPAELLESELFGHVKGAFTGAFALKHGLFEAADGGTLLLDEIGEMPLALQAKLLRVLQNGEIRRVGDTRSFSVDVRMLCATHQNLRTCMAERRFREDLYYRLSVFTLTIPPLRERPEDILPLTRMLLAQETDSRGEMTEEAELALQAYAWPGNVRQLANAIKHGAVLAQGKPIGVAHLPPEVVSPATRRGGSARLRTLADVERAHIVQVLEACDGRCSEAARVLGIGRTTLWRKLRAFGIETAD